jgi:hypothetical protein
MTSTVGPPARSTLADVRSAVSDEAWMVDDLLADVRGADPFLPFDERSLAFCEALSRDLLAEREEPQAVALGYWLRRASVERARAWFRSSESPGIVLVPRGLAFHVTPANVDTVFVYSWILSMLAGNANIVRLSSRSTRLRDRLTAGIARAFAEPRFEALRRRNRIVLTGHDERVSRAISSVADVRVLWGGNATVERFRGYPLPPRGRDLTFPDRHSIAILDAGAVARATDEEIARLADDFFNDAFWFDQGACSSPRLLLWVGPAAERADEARRRFHAAVGAAVERRGYVAQTGTVISKLVLAYERAARQDGVRVETASNEVTWVDIPSLQAYDRASCGGGIFFEHVSDDLAADLSALAAPEDQTAACFGLEAAAVRDLARALAGRGIDRFVRMGRALEFGIVWDGYDLLGEFSKRVVVDVGA